MLSSISFKLPNEEEVYTIVGSWRKARMNESLFPGFYVSNFKGDLFRFNEILADASIKYAKYKEENVISKEEYLTQVKTLASQMEEGEFDKIVLSRVKEIESDLSEEDFFNKIVSAHPDKFCYQAHMPDGTLWFGASPEVLIESNAGQIKTMALAGTQKKNQSNSYSWTEKEINEHEFVVDYISNILDSNSNQWQKGNREVVEAGPVVHLKTGFEASVDQEKISDILSKLQPTPAVCGIPKEKTKSIIEEFEVHDRSFYTGLIGVQQGDSCKFYVNLRCVRKSKKGFQVFVGGGLTKDSNPEKEWEETELKADALF